MYFETTKRSSSLHLYEVVLLLFMRKSDCEEHSIQVAHINHYTSSTVLEILLRSKLNREECCYSNKHSQQRGAREIGLSTCTSTVCLATFASKSQVQSQYSGMVRMYLTLATCNLLSPSGPPQG